MPSNTWSGEQAAHWALRIGLAFAFLYPPVMAVGDPISWAGYFPPFARDLPIDIEVLLHAFGIIEAAIALWILSGWKIRVPAILAALMLAGIVLFNWNQLDVLFRDLSIAMMALALALWPSARPARAPAV